MKVTVQKPEVKFQPITIILEDKDEAAAMWHVINQYLDEDYCSMYGLKGNYTSAFQEAVYNELDPLIGEYARGTMGRHV
jgi:hypothetical protein